MDTYTDGAGVERCDNCNEEVDGCECRCTECGDTLQECGCPDGPTVSAAN